MATRGQATCCQQRSRTQAVAPPMAGLAWNRAGLEAGGTPTYIALPLRAVRFLRWIIGPMITCVLDYVIDATKISDFERFAARWIELVEAHGGIHHGYFLPSE